MIHMIPGIVCYFEVHTKFIQYLYVAFSKTLAVVLRRADSEVLLLSTGYTPYFDSAYTKASTAEGGRCEKNEKLETLVPCLPSFCCFTCIHTLAGAPSLYRKVWSRKRRGATHKHTRTHTHENDENDENGENENESCVYG